jgi:hypothetical protein
MSVAYLTRGCRGLTSETKTFASGQKLRVLARLWTCLGVRQTPFTNGKKPLA